MSLLAAASGRGSGSAPGTARPASWSVRRNRRRDQRRDPPAQDVEAAADADAGRREEDLERRDGADEEPAERWWRRAAKAAAARPMKVAPSAWAKRGGYSCSGSAGGPRRRRAADQRPRRGPAGRGGCRTRPRRRGWPDEDGEPGRRRKKAPARTAAETPAPKRWPRGSIGRAGGVRMDTGDLRGRGTAGRVSPGARWRGGRRGGVARPARGAGGQRAIATVPRTGTRRGQEQQEPLQRRRARVVMGGA